MKEGEVKIKFVDFVFSRINFVLKLCENKKVLHLGCCDWPFTQMKYKNKSLLFLLIEKVCKKQLGLDNDKKSISYLHKKEHTNIKFFDLNKSNKIDFKPDIIIFGETLEHLMNLEIALSNIKKLMTKNTKLIITVPNSSRLYTFRNSLFGKSFEHPDHKVCFFPFTLKNLLVKNKYQVDNIKIQGSLTSNLVFKNKFLNYLIFPVRIFVSLLYYLFIRIFPMFGNCIIICCHKK